MLRAIICTDCRKASYHPEDLRQRYCAMCRRFRTGEGEAVMVAYQQRCVECVPVGWLRSEGSTGAVLVVDYEEGRAEVRYERCGHVKPVELRVLPT